jgi:dTDP-4-dehydrorhamnose 3,5-epimerase
MIDGVKIQALKIIPDERGAIMHGVRSDNILNPFGEVYFSKVFYEAIKGWHVHETLILNYICVYGQVKLVLYDMRENSPTKGEIQEIFMGMDNYCLVHIPPGIANGTKGLWEPYSIVCNVASEPHNPNIQYRRIRPDEGIIKYDWNRKVY